MKMKFLILFFFFAAGILSAAVNPAERIYELSDGKPGALAKYLASLPKKSCAAMINIRNKEGSLPILRAIERGKVKNVEILLEYGADPNIGGLLPSEEAAKNFSYAKRFGVVKLKLKNSCSGAPKTVLVPTSKNSRTNRQYFTPVSFLSREKMANMDPEEEMKILNLLLKYDADPNSHDPDTRYTPLMNYLQRGFTEAIELLLKHEKTDLHASANGVSLEEMANKTKNDKNAKLILRALRLERVKQTLSE